MSGRLVGLLAAILAALFSAPSPAATAVPEAVVVGYTYAGDHHIALSIDTVTERDPPVVAYDCTAPASAAYAPAVRVAHSDNASVTARTASHGNAGGIHVVPASRCAARTGTPGADDVLNGVRLRAQLTGQEISGGHVEVGEKVWARNLRTGKNELRTVTGLFHKHADQVMTITVAGGSKVTVTEEHPFYVTGLGWVMSRDLKVGDQLAQRDGGSTTVTAIGVRRTGTTVYNFTVEGDHNYYVTNAQLLVHNCDLIPGNPFRGPNAPRDAYTHLERYHGLDPKIASNRLHVIKRNAGLGAADDVVIGRTGDVYDARTGELLDSLTNPGLGTAR